MQRLKAILAGLDGRGYKAYKQLTGTYDFGSFQLTIDHVQGDPYALPSRISLQLDAQQHGIPGDLWRTSDRQTALEDFIGRTLDQTIRSIVKGGRGTGRSGDIEIAVNGQQVLKRNAVVLTNDILDARLLFALPGSGRSTLVKEAAAMFFDELPRIVALGLSWSGKSLETMRAHIACLEDQNTLRTSLSQLNAVSFVANGAMLPRRSGVDDRPLEEGIPFVSPPSLLREMTLPNQGNISGMLIPAGVTLIVGGGFHGKSTLLQALERGVYNHIPGDGRERVVTDATAVKIRAEDHRAINGVDISPFIATLPGNRQTASFTTENASGSTSQAANIIEALECGCRCLLIDEDTSATNFMIRDARMQRLVPDDQEPITPFLHRVRELYEEHGVSSIIVMGGSGYYLSVADHVIMLDQYRAYDVTEKAGSLAGERPRKKTGQVPFGRGALRRVSFPLDPLPRQRTAKILVRENRLLDYGCRRIDLNQVEQLLDAGQTEAIGRLLARCDKHDPEQREGLVVTLQKALKEIEAQGLDLLLPWKAGHLAMPRLYELAAAANRLRK